jgi:uncharacterized protein (DUF169 family)
MNNSEARNSLLQLLGSNAEPVAVSFCDTRPAGAERIASAAPAGCAYWKLAADGEVFYTVREDHLNCPIGAYTHGAELDADSKGQLEGMIGKMVGIQYLRMDEVGGIPKRKDALHFVLYSPLSKAQEVPDVVLFRGNARQIMLVVEAANALSLMSGFPVMGRPACAVIAATVNSGLAATSLGCIGNRIYTQLPDDEFYVAVPGRALNNVLEALRSIVSANSQLEQYHRSRCVCA